MKDVCLGGFLFFDFAFSFGSGFGFGVGIGGPFVAEPFCLPLPPLPLPLPPLPVHGAHSAPIGGVVVATSMTSVTTTLAMRQYVLAMLLKAEHCSLEERCTL